MGSVLLVALYSSTGVVRVLHAAKPDRHILEHGKAVPVVETTVQGALLALYKQRIGGYKEQGDCIRCKSDIKNRMSLMAYPTTCMVWSH